ncbi:putative phosphatidylinositol 3-kinase [Helianthus annuus]|nr:putative phosphatidylinositol 3-kinase [Helianthus annuus]KAJ0460578.1 putative phosphatidylinositol 3-kinase [Helianthus annuus]
MGAFDGGNGFKLWQSLVRQTELTAQLCSIMRDIRNVRDRTQKKIEKLRHLLSGLLSELTYFEEAYAGGCYVWFMLWDVESYAGSRIRYR